jgi:hypothetical protein
MRVKENRKKKGKSDGENERSPPLFVGESKDLQNKQWWCVSKPNKKYKEKEEYHPYSR